jgi:hypothetical protein
MTIQPVEISIKGKPRYVPSAQVENKTIIAKGRWVRVAEIKDELVSEGESVRDPDSFLDSLKSKLKADVFTFTQKLPDVKPKFRLPFEPDNVASIRITTFKDWWDRLPQSTRRNVRLAAKRGVSVRSVPFNDDFVRGIHRICNESPVRQGRRFWHFGKDFETIKRIHATYLARSEFLAAFCENELIGYLKMVYVDRTAILIHFLVLNSQHEKKPGNALIAKAVEICEQKGVSDFLYGRLTYGNKQHSSLVEFKLRNGFEQIDFPRYYVPLTIKGRIFVGLRLYRGPAGVLPEPILRMIVGLRSSYYRLVFAKTGEAVT